MAKCNFSIAFSGTAEAIYQRAKSAVENQGGSFKGDAAGGEFSINVFGAITGTYAVNGQQLEVVITDKPMMLPCNMIESALKSQIGE